MSNLFYPSSSVYSTSRKTQPKSNHFSLSPVHFQCKSLWSATATELVPNRLQAPRGHTFFVCFICRENTNGTWWVVGGQYIESWTNKWSLILYCWPTTIWQPKWCLKKCHCLISHHSPTPLLYPPSMHSSSSEAVGFSVLGTFPFLMYTLNKLLVILKYTSNTLAFIELTIMWGR